MNFYHFIKIVENLLTADLAYGIILLVVMQTAQRGCHNGWHRQDRPKEKALDKAGPSVT
ncbi:MAG TPA: hypothetical protein VN207_02905 [Ktedonobacteraceae bacterium]|nr:hypothetical protein [Ktedonobacteraceae bacterium]